MAKNAQYIFELNGKIVAPPREWPDLEITANLDTSEVPALESDALTWVNESAQVFIDWINAGANGTGKGIFEGIPLKIRVYNDNGIQKVAFDGYTDLSSDYEQNATHEVMAKIAKDSQEFSFMERASVISYAFLYDEGVITDSDFIKIPYVVEKPVDPLAIIVISITTYLLIKELAEATARTASAIATAAGMLASGVTGSVGSAIYAVAIALINAAYAALLVVAILNLVKQLAQYILSPVRSHKTMTLKSLIEKGVEYMGYTLETDIPELDQYCQLPSKPTEENPVQYGFPNATDFGYTLGESIELAKRLFNIDRVVIVDNVVQLRSANSPYWVKKSSYVLPDVIEVAEKIKYNTEDLRSSIFINFSTDLSDEWTIENFTGTNYEVLTRPINVGNQRFVNVRNAENIQIPLALGNRKDSLTLVETLLKTLFGTADRIVKTFGGRSNLSGKILNRIGALRLWNNIHATSKLIIVEGGKIPANHRDRLSAKYLWNQYHNERSFVDNDFGKQRKKFTQVRIPFGLEDFNKVIDNSYFKTSQGDEGKFTRIVWNVSKDFAIADFWIKFVYTRNLKEIKIEG